MTCWGPLMAILLYLILNTPQWGESYHVFCYFAKWLQLRLTLCNPIEGSPPGSPVPGILQARNWSGLLYPSAMHESEVAQSCPTLSDPMDCSLPGFSAHRIFQARVLEWGAIVRKLLIRWETPQGWRSLPRPLSHNMHFWDRMAQVCHPLAIKQLI